MCQNCKQLGRKCFSLCAFKVKPIVSFLDKWHVFSFLNDVIQCDACHQFKSTSSTDLQQLLNGANIEITKIN